MGGRICKSSLTLTETNTMTPDQFALEYAHKDRRKNDGWDICRIMSERHKDWKSSGTVHVIGDGSLELRYSKKHPSGDTITVSFAALDAARPKATIRSHEGRFRKKHFSSSTGCVDELIERVIAKAP